jgi:hypothetical protein
MIRLVDRKALGQTFKEDADAKNCQRAQWDEDA